jgi:Uma2 family endonuclease
MVMLPRGAEEILGEAIRPLKRVEFDKLVAEGFFENERVELLFGMVVQVAPPDPEHGESLFRLAKMLAKQLGDRAVVRDQLPLAATEDSEPQPDVYVIPTGDYWHEHPSHAHLVVEVSRSSLRRDRAKRTIYAAAMVEEYWIVNHNGDCVEVYRDARDGEWQTKTTHRRGDVLSPRAFPDVRIPIDEILPPKP